MGAGIQPGGLAGMANAPAVGRHGQQGIPHNMGEAPGQWQGLPRHQNDTALSAFQGQALAGLNNAGAGPQGQEAPWVLVSNLGDWRAWQMHRLGVRNQITSIKCLTGFVGILLPENRGCWHFSCLITMAVGILLLDNVKV
jgi:hypothetical protein